MWPAILKVVLNNGGIHQIEAEVNSGICPKGTLARTGPDPFVAFFWHHPGSDEPYAFDLETAIEQFRAVWTLHPLRCVIYFNGLVESIQNKEDAVADKLVQFLTVP